MADLIWPWLTILDLLEKHSPHRQLDTEMEWIFLIPCILEESPVAIIILRANCCLLGASQFFYIQYTQIQIYL